MKLAAAVLYLLLITSSIGMGFSHWAYDDPFITYRYAANLAQGSGFVYNPGERVLSTTTPLFALLLAALGSFGLDLPLLANGVGALSLALGGLLLWDLSRVWQTPWVGWAGLLLYPTFPLLVSALGSETPLYLALCLGAFASSTRRRYTLAALASALAILARPDGALVAVVLIAAYLYHSGRIRTWTTGFSQSYRSLPWRAIFVFAALLLAWFGFAWAYFGSPLPVTLAAKQQQGGMAISQRFAAGFITVLGWYNVWPYWLQAALALLGLILGLRRGRSWLWLLSWTALYFAAYSILGVSRYFWYYAPLVPGFVALVGLGLQAIARQWQTAADYRSRWWGAGRQALAMSILLVIFLAQARALWLLRQQPDTRYTIYRAAGEWLASHTAPQATVGALEVGIIGYYARRPMIDFAGLIQPEVARQLRPESTYEDAARWAVERYHPDYLVMFPGMFPNLEQGYIKRACNPVQIFAGQMYGHANDLIIYHCQ
jgi:hypothetical protein